MTWKLAIALLGLSAASAVDAASVVRNTVLVDVDVDTSGHATHTAVVTSSGSKDIDARAIVAVEKWHFNPAMVREKPVAAHVRVPVVIESDAAPHPSSSS